jgi:hypothetical protein
VAATETKRTTDAIKIDAGVEGFAGEYPFDQSALTWGDLRLIQRESGVRAGEFDSEVRRGNVELVIAMAKIALKKAGHRFADRFDDALDKMPLDGPAPLAYLSADSEDAAPLDPPSSNDSPT